jgi:hypothetical protein
MKGLRPAADCRKVKASCWQWNINMQLDVEHFQDLVVPVHAKLSDIMPKVLLRLSSRESATHHAGACEVVSTLMAVMP